MASNNAAAVKAANNLISVVGSQAAPKRRKLTAGQRTQASRARASKKIEQAKSERQREVIAAETQGKITLAQEKARLRQQATAVGSRRTARNRMQQQAIDTSVTTVSHPTRANPILLIIFTMAGLILFYQIVTTATQFSGFLGSLQNGLRKLSTTSPLFETVTPGGKSPS